MKLNTIVFGALIALSTSALQASEVKSNGDVKQPEILASVSTDKVVPLTAQEAKDTRGAYWICNGPSYTCYYGFSNENEGEWYYSWTNQIPSNAYWGSGPSSEQMYNSQQIVYHNPNNPVYALGKYYTYVGR